MWIRPAAVLAIYVALTRCADQGAPDDFEPGEIEPTTFEVELWTHPFKHHRVESGHEVRDRSAVELLVGAQGLRMAILVLHVSPDAVVPLTVQADIESGTSTLASQQLVLDALTRDDDGLVYHDLLLTLTATAVMPDDWARLRVLVSDATGTSVEVLRTVRLVSDPGAN